MRPSSVGAAIAVSDIVPERPVMTRPVAVVTVTFNAADHVAAMVDSVQASQDLGAVPIVAVDNGSTDGTVAALREFAGVQVIEQSNVGYAGGVNRGIAAAPPGHDILILNPDMVLQAGCVVALSETLHRSASHAIAVPVLYDESGELQPSLRREPTWWRTLVETLVGGTRAGRLGEAYRPDVSVREPQTADWATGAAMLVRRETLEQLGHWDESYFLYSEETEFCLRVRDAGYRLVVNPQAVGMHIGGEMSRDPRLWALRAVNRVRLYGQRRGRLSTAAFRLTAILFELRRALTGDAVSRAALSALTVRDLDTVAVRLARALGGDPRPILAALPQPHRS